jgi:hypothetical protein
VATDRTSLEAYLVALAEKAAKHTGPIGLPESFCIVSSGTKARIIGESSLIGFDDETACHVEILSGPMEFRAAWVFATQVASQTKDSGRD